MQTFSPLHPFKASGWVLDPTGLGQAVTLPPRLPQPCSCPRGLPWQGSHGSLHCPCSSCFVPAGSWPGTATCLVGLSLGGHLLGTSPPTPNHLRGHVWEPESLLSSSGKAGTAARGDSHKLCGCLFASTLQQAPPMGLQCPSARGCRLQCRAPNVSSAAREDGTLGPAPLSPPPGPLGLTPSPLLSLYTQPTASRGWGLQGMLPGPH